MGVGRAGRLPLGMPDGCGVAVNDIAGNAILALHLLTISSDCPTSAVDGIAILVKNIELRQRTPRVAGDFRKRFQLDITHCADRRRLHWRRGHL